VIQSIDSCISRWLSFSVQHWGRAHCLWQRCHTWLQLDGCFRARHSPPVGVVASFLLTADAARWIFQDLGRLSPSRAPDVAAVRAMGVAIIVAKCGSTCWVIGVHCSVYILAAAYTTDGDISCLKRHRALAGQSDWPLWPPCDAYTVWHGYCRRDGLPMYMGVPLIDWPFIMLRILLDAVEYCERKTSQRCYCGAGAAGSQVNPWWTEVRRYVINATPCWRAQGLSLSVFVCGVLSHASY